MKNTLPWDECINKHIIHVDANKDKAKSMLKMAELRQEHINDETLAFKKIEEYYEITKELISTLMLLEGLKSSNHECITTYFSHIFGDLKYEFTLIHELKEIRNKIQYDGFFPSETYLKRNELEFTYIINIIKLRILEKLNIS